MKPSSSAEQKQIHLVVNGTWMRRLEFNRNLLDAGVVFTDESQTAAIDRLWFINDRYPGILRVNKGGPEIALGLWEGDITRRRILWGCIYAKPKKD
jgi:hypothetical protein